MKKVFGKAIDNAISLGVVIIVLFLIIPIRTELLDFLLIINIGLSIMILMITMNISETLEFSIFPSLLLVTTTGSERIEYPGDPLQGLRR